MTTHNIYLGGFTWEIVYISIHDYIRVSRAERKERGQLNKLGFAMRLILKNFQKCSGAWNGSANYPVHVIIDPVQEQKFSGIYIR